MTQRIPNRIFLGYQLFGPRIVIYSNSHILLGNI